MNPNINYQRKGEMAWLAQDAGKELWFSWALTEFCCLFHVLTQILCHPAGCANSCAALCGGRTWVCILQLWVCFLKMISPSIASVFSSIQLLWDRCYFSWWTWRTLEERNMDRKALLHSVAVFTSLKENSVVICLLWRSKCVLTDSFPTFSMTDGNFAGCWYWNCHFLLILHVSYIQSFK